MCRAVVSRRLCEETCWLFHNFPLGSGNEVLSCSDHDAKLSSSSAGESPRRGAPRQQLAWHIRPLQHLHKERSTLCGHVSVCSPFRCKNLQFDNPTVLQSKAPNALPLLLCVLTNLSNFWSQKWTPLSARASRVAVEERRHQPAVTPVQVTEGAIKQLSAQVASNSRSVRQH